MENGRISSKREANKIKRKGRRIKKEKKEKNFSS